MRAWLQNRLHLAYLLWGVALFVVFAVGNFPYQQTMRIRLAQLGLRLSYGNSVSTFPIGIRLSDVGLAVISNTTGPQFTLASLTVAPSAGVILGRAAVRASTNLYGGELTAIVSRAEGSGTAITFRANQLDAARLGFKVREGGRVAGRLSIRGEVLSSGAQLKQASGIIEVEGRNLRIYASSDLPPLNLDLLKGRFRLRDGRLEVLELTGLGPDLKLKGSGSIEIGDDFSFSAYSMGIALEPAAAGTPALVPLLNLMPHPPQLRPFVLFGPLSAPSLG